MTYYAATLGDIACSMSFSLGLSTVANFKEPVQNLQNALIWGGVACVGSVAMRSFNLLAGFNKTTIAVPIVVAGAIGACIGRELPDRIGNAVIGVLCAAAVIGGSYAALFAVGRSVTWLTCGTAQITRALENFIIHYSK